MKRPVRTVGTVAAITLSAVAAGFAAFFFAPHTLSAVAPSENALTGEALVEQGRYLVVAGDCAACHTAPGGRPFAGGLPFQLPFGKIYSANITSDRTKGIGDWSAAEFVRAMRHGVGKNGEDLYPAFPYTSYATLRDDDMLAIFAYLQTINPVAEAPPNNDLWFPFNQRWTLRSWKLLFLDSSIYVDDTNKSSDWNRGAYLVKGLAHCGECHTPRNLLFARESSKELSGGTVDGWRAWNITPDKRTGIGMWDDKSLESYLSTGAAFGHGSTTGSMRQAVDLSFSRLHGPDIQGIVTYLKSIPPITSTDPAPSLSNSALEEATAWSSGQTTATLGRTLFAGACASCHAWDGNGQATERQALIGDRNVNDPKGTNLIRLLLEGSAPQDDNPSRAMPSFASAYTDGEIAALSNYVIEHFGGVPGEVDLQSVKSARDEQQK